MTKPLRMWCVKMPRGQLMKGTVDANKDEAIWLACDEKRTRFHSIHAPQGDVWAVLQKQGYAVVRVTVEEEG